MSSCLRARAMMGSVAGYEEVARMNVELEPMPEDWRRGLAVVAHPDDVEYGIAGAVAEWIAAGRDLAYLLVTRGEAGIDGMAPDEAAVVREREQRAAAAAVGVSSVEFLAHRDGVIVGGVELRREVAFAIRRHQPELLVTINHRDTWGRHNWNTSDHRVVGRAVLDAAADAGNRWIFPDQLDDGDVRPWNGVRWVAVAGSPEATHATAVSKPCAQQAVESLAAHRTYLAALHDAHPTDAARSVLDSTMPVSERHGGRRVVSFELFAR